MHTRQSLWEDLEKLGLLPTDTVLIHSSLKAVGPVEGRGEGLLQALIDYFSPEGLLLFPTHTWAQIGPKRPVFHAATEPSCVGALSNLALTHPQGVRSLHPTHSVKAFGRDAAAYVAGEEKSATPCPRSGCWGRLIDRQAKILLMGCPAARNTFLHAVEEDCGIPDRLALEPFHCVSIGMDGTQYPILFHPHFSSHGDVSQHYGKAMPWFISHGAARQGKVGDAVTYAAGAAEMHRLLCPALAQDPQLFSDERPMPAL